MNKVTVSVIVSHMLYGLKKLLSSAIEACLACCAACFLGCIEQMVEYFNRFAYLFTSCSHKTLTSGRKDMHISKLVCLGMILLPLLPRFS
jgi:Plasma-membrane choline transporter